MKILPDFTGRFLVKSNLVTVIAEYFIYPRVLHVYKYFKRFVIWNYFELCRFILYEIIICLKLFEIL